MGTLAAANGSERKPTGGVSPHDSPCPRPVCVRGRRSSSAAEAVEMALRELIRRQWCRTSTCSSFTNAAFRQFYGRAYLDLVNRAPHALGYFYDLLDRAPSSQHKADRLRLLVEKLNLRKFLKFLQGADWDVIVNTHFLPAEMIASLRRLGQFDAPHLTVTTDFETHRLWVNQPCDHYFTATEEGAVNLQQWGVPAADVTVTGIPIHPAFSKAKDRAECRRRLQLSEGRPVILQLAGGFGVGPVEKLCHGILAVETPLELVVVAGRNEELKTRLEQIRIAATTPAPRAGLHDADGRTDGSGRFGGVEAGRPDDLGSPGTRHADGCRQSDSGPGEPQQRLSAGKRRGHQDQQCGHAVLQAGPIAWRPDQLAHLAANARRLGRPRAAFEVAQAALGWPCAGQDPSSRTS